MNPKPRPCPASTAWVLFNSDNIMAHGAPRAALVESVRRRKAGGEVVMLWSKRGESIAKDRAERHGLLELFTWAPDSMNAFADEPGLSESDYIKLVLDGLQSRAAQKSAGPWG